VRIAILGVKTYPATAGADRVVENLLEHLSPEIEIYLYLSKIDNSVRLTNRGNVSFIYIPTIRGKHIKAFLYFLLSSLHVLLRKDIDIIHVHNSDFGLFTLLLRLRKKVKVIGTFHGNPYLRKKWGVVAKGYLKFSESLFIRMCHVLTTVARSKIDQLDGKYRRKIVYIPNGIDVIPPSALRDEFEYGRFGLEKGDYLMFACGRLDSTKGLHHLLRAYNRVALDGLKLLVVGDFTHDLKYSASVETMAKAIDGVVILKKLLPKSTLFEVIGNSRAFVFPSEVEGMSMMLLEAISARVPVVCSDIPENLEVVGEDYPYAFESENPKSLASKLCLLIADKDIKRLSDALFHRVRFTLNWANIAKQYESIYKSLIGG
jgi:glycosyltransferase involved in cell wall biosynthesis